MTAGLGIKARAILALADLDGEVAFPRELAVRLGTDEHNIVHALHRLRKENLVRCRLSKRPIPSRIGDGATARRGGSRANLYMTDVRLTTAGWALVDDLRKRGVHK